MCHKMRSEDDAECRSITYFESGWCSHFSTECTKRKLASDAIAMGLKTGQWMQAEPTGCATKCGVGAGLSGTPGAVICSTSSCDPATKPSPKQCPRTVDCHWDPKSKAELQAAIV